MMDQTRIGASDFDYYLRELFDGMQVGAANVVSLAGFEVGGDIRHSSDGVSKIG